MSRAIRRIMSAVQPAVSVVITVTPSGNYQTMVQNTLNTLAARTDKTTQYIIQFAPGTYTLTNQWTVMNLQNVHITSQNPTNPATICKSSTNWGGEYLLRFYYGSNLHVSHLNWTGLHVYNPSDDTVHWGDQGIWFASTHDTRVDHCGFTNIGNAAVRHNTFIDDSPGIHSYNHLIEDNTFSNCWQITTTQEGDTTHGGSHDWTFQRNTLTNARGSVKFATRTAGGYNGHIIDNIWQSSSGSAIEICSEDYVDVQRNNFANIGGFLVNAYTNDAQPTGFAWGNNFTFKDNVSTSSGDGFRISLNPYNDGYQPTGTNLIFDNNTISNTKNSGAEPFRVVNGGINGITFTNNRFSNIAYSSPYYFDPTCSNIMKSGNTLNSVAYP